MPLFVLTFVLSNFKLYIMSKLTSEQMAKIEPKINHRKCPVCGSTHLTFNEYPTQVLSYSTGDKDIDLSNVSWINCLSGECLDCGFIMQFRLDTLLK